MNQTTNLQAGAAVKRDTEMELIMNRLDALKLNLSAGVSNIRCRVERLNGAMPEIPATTEPIPTKTDPPAIERIMRQIADIEYLSSSLHHVDDQFSRIINAY